LIVDWSNTAAPADSGHPRSGGQFSAKDSGMLKASSFTSAPIAKALVDAHKRGVKVQVVLDKSWQTEK
jgi:hypothetical protein